MQMNFGGATSQYAEKIFNKVAITFRGHSQFMLTARGRGRSHQMSTLLKKSQILLSKAVNQGERGVKKDQKICKRSF